VTETASFDLADLTRAPDPLAASPAAAAAEANPEAPVDRLGERLKAIAARRISGRLFTYPVPEWDDLLHVRYGEIEAGKVRSLRAEAAAVPGTKDVEFTASVLVAHCREVLVRADDGSLGSADVSEPGAAAPVFDKRLADALGVPFAGAEALCIALYHEGYVESTYAALASDSGFGQVDAVRASRGND